jgi:hypothetical protein
MHEVAMTIRGIGGRRAADVCLAATGPATGIRRRSALAAALGALTTAVGVRGTRAETDDLVVCKATFDMDHPYQRQTISAWQLEEWDLHPVPAGGCPQQCLADADEICRGQCGDVEVSCGRFTSTFDCGECRVSAESRNGKRQARKRRKQGKRSR